MTGFDPNSQKSFAEIRDGIDQSIMRYCWAKTGECPVCGCESSILFDEQTHNDDKYVEIEDCELCNAVLQAVAGDLNLIAQ